ncbi:unnamed protein product [Ixodes persulcatus]
MTCGHASSRASYYRSVAGDISEAVEKKAKGQVQSQNHFFCCQ